MSLELRGISKTFGGSAPVLDNVDLSVPSGEFIALLGPSGCGKSTLLKVIAGLLDQDRGEVRLDGQRVDGLSPKARDIAMVFQTYALYPHMSAFDNMAVPLRMRRLKLADRIPLLRYLTQDRSTLRAIDGEVEQTADLLGIKDLLARKPGQLSGGQRQRVAIGRAIVRRPRVFLMDEPLSNLDAALRVQMQAELIELHRRLGVTIVYVTHDQAEAMTMSQRIGVMFDGKLLQLGSPSEIYASPQHLRVARFIGTPEINVMRGEVRDRRLRIGDRTLPVEFQGVADGPVSLGFRPEAIRLANRRNALFAGRAELLRNLGSEVLLSVILENGLNEKVTLRLHPHEDGIPVRGAETFLAFDLNKCLVFDSEGERLPILLRERETSVA